MSACRGLLLSSCLALCLSAHAQVQDLRVAGLQPDRRPEGAPVVRAAPVEPPAKSARLTGITPPWPGNVERIAEQGAWYSPMFRPGMNPPYDLRGWHGARPR